MRHVLLTMATASAVLTTTTAAPAAVSGETGVLWEAPELPFAPLAILFIPEPRGEIKETELSVTIQTDPGADVSNLRFIVLGALLDEGSGDLFGVSHVFTAADLGLAGSGLLTGSATTSAFNGLLPTDAQSPGPFAWEVEIASSTGGFEFFGEGSARLEATFVPAPGAAAIIGFGGMVMLRRRRR